MRAKRDRHAPRHSWATSPNRSVPATRDIPGRDREAVCSRGVFGRYVMPVRRIPCQGWISLPFNLRRKLNLKSGDRLEMQLLDGVIALWPAAKGQVPLQIQKSIETSAAESLTTSTPVSRRPGRPQKILATDPPVVVPKARRARRNREPPIPPDLAAALLALAIT